MQAKKRPSDLGSTRLKDPYREAQMDNSPVKKKQLISASSIFKPRPRGAKTQSKVLKQRIAVAVERSVDRPLVIPRKAKSSSSTRSPRKKVPEPKRKERPSDTHPLAAEFKQTTTDYKTYVYETTTAKIEATYNELVAALDDANASAESADANHPTLELPYGTLILRQIQHMYQPIGDSRLVFRRRNEYGEETAHELSLEERITRFDAKIDGLHKEIITLQKSWETIIGEIWKCGVQFLGEDTMKVLLYEPQSQPSQEAVEEDTLFIPENGSNGVLPPVVGPLKKKKRVSFQDPMPEFLTQPSVMRSKAPDMPALPFQELQEMKEGINELGGKSLADLKELDTKHKKWFARKKKQLEEMWKNDN